MKVRRISLTVAALGCVAIVLGYQFVRDDKHTEPQPFAGTSDPDDYVEPLIVQDKLVGQGAGNSVTVTSTATTWELETSETKDFYRVKQHLGDPMRDVDDLPEPITPIRIGDPLRSVDDLPRFSTRIALGDALRSVDDLPSTSLIERLGDDSRDIDDIPQSATKQALGQGRTIEQ